MLEVLAWPASHSRHRLFKKENTHYMYHTLSLEKQATTEMWMGFAAFRQLEVVTSQANYDAKCLTNDTCKNAILLQYLTKNKAAASQTHSCKAAKITMHVTIYTYIHICVYTYMCTHTHWKTCCICTSLNFSSCIPCASRCAPFHCCCNVKGGILLSYWSYQRLST